MVATDTYLSGHDRERAADEWKIDNEFERAFKYLICFQAFSSFVGCIVPSQTRFDDDFVCKGPERFIQRLMALIRLEQLLEL